MVTPAAHAAPADPLLEGARQCTQYFPVQEQKQSIPTHLLAAIATTESGRWHDGLDMFVPWPWTINVEGKGYYFDTKGEAIAQTQRFMAQGKRSIDVGCMQVNLKHHPDAFASLEQAFDPSTNVAYAAKFLHDNYADLGDWIKATAAYHSRTESYGNKYLVAIEQSWNRIVSRVAAARSRGGSVPASEVAATAAPVTPVSAEPMRPAQTQHVMKVVETASPKADVLVIRPAFQPPAEASSQVTIATAEQTQAAADQEMLVQQPKGNSIRRVSLDSPAQNGVAASSNSRFVFAN